MESSQISMQIVNPFAAGIDVGSRSHFVSIGQNADQVKEFGVFSEDLIALARWLIDNKIGTVAMESTGTYWQNLFATLQEFGLEVNTLQWKVYKKHQR